MPTSMLPPRHIIAGALSLIPTHRQPAQTPEYLLGKLIDQTGATEAVARLALTAAFALLDAVNGLRWQETAEGATTQTQAQLSTYFSRSLQLELEAGEGWRVTPDLLRLLEQQRLDAAQRTNTLAEPAREQAAVLLLIVQHVAGDTCLLHQFDAAANQFQLIGGRLEPGEQAEATAWRELQEEIGGSQLHPLSLDKIALRPALDTPIALQGLSSTYGVLTSYTFFVFHLHWAGPALHLGPFDRWIRVRDMLAGRTDDGHSLGLGDIASALDTRLPDGLAGLPSSFDESLPADVKPDSPADTTVRGGR